MLADGAFRGVGEAKAEDVAFASVPFVDEAVSAAASDDDDCPATLSPRKSLVGAFASSALAADAVDLGTNTAAPAAFERPPGTARETFGLVEEAVGGAAAGALRMEGVD